jgi:hypothetical protein
MSRSIKIVLQRFFVVTLGGLFAGSPALADAYRTPGLKVMPGEVVLMEPSQLQPPYSFGSNFSLTRQNHFPGSTAAVMNRGFELRIFRVEGDKSPPRPWLQDQDHCDIFLSVVFKNLHFYGDKIDLGPLQKLHWLTVRLFGRSRRRTR